MPRFTALILVLSFLFLSLPCQCEEEILAKPTLIFRSEPPAIPQSIRQSNASGIALIKALIDDNGKVIETEMIRSTNYSVLDRTLKDWVSEWQYLPRLREASRTSGFTIITIRYNIANQTFDAPQPIAQAIEIPDQLVTTESLSSDHSATKGLPFPDPPLKITNIPVNIQKLALKGNTNLTMTINAKGTVTAISSQDDLKPEIFKEWLLETISKSKWTFPESAVREKITLVLPVEYQTDLCKISFGHPIAGADANPHVPTELPK
ncbi:TonB family protein [bacterium]|nr:TonB family protein [candidate division CSSED10-310 bacterium]